MKILNISILAAIALSSHSTDALQFEDHLEKVYFGGRWWREGDAMRHSWGTGTFEVRFTGSTGLGVEMGAALAGAYYTCTVDDGPEQRLLVSNNYQNPTPNAMTFTGLSAAEEHVVRCGRNNEASYGDTIVSGILLDTGGQLLKAEDPNADNRMIRFEAIGDSITAGYKVTVPAGSSDPATIVNQDVFQTYIRLMADAWGTTDYQVIAKSGVSILDYGTTGIVMPREWPCREYWAGWEGDCPELWDFNVWQADVVTVNLGTNDFAFGNPTQQQFREGYLAFLQQIRANYPNALIACIEPIQHSCSGESFAKLTGIVDGTEQAVNDMNDEKVIFYETGRTSDPWLDCSLSTQDFMDFTHPTVQGNQKFATNLLEAMTDDVRRFFPQKCGGTGPICGEGAPVEPQPTASPVEPQPTASPVANPTASPMSSPVAPPPTASPVSSPGGTSCTAVPQSELPTGAWAATDDSCQKCQEGYQWWPCDAKDPALCNCQDNNDDQSAPTTTPQASPTASPVSPTVSPVSNPVPLPPTNAGGCTAVPQSELPSGTWATTDEFCNQCQDGYEWWPCDTTDPALCRCENRRRAMLRSGK